MSGVLGNLSKKISNTLDNAQKDLRQSVAKSLSVAASSISTTRTLSAGSKTRLFTTILERSQRARDNIIDHRDPNEHNVNGTVLATAGVERDDVQDKLATFARLEREFCDLIEAYEILLVERIHLEEIITGSSQLESLDDLELVGQYYKAIQDTSQISKMEIARLTSELDELKSKQHTEGVAIEYATEAEAAENESRAEAKTEDNIPTDKALIDAEEQLAILKQQLLERDDRIKELASKQSNLLKEKNETASRKMEGSNLLTALESQKMALETKVSYLTKQLQDYDGMRSKMQQVFTTSQSEVQSSREELAKCRQRLDLAEAELQGTKRELEACQVELSLIRGEHDQSIRTLSSENCRLGIALKTAEALLEEERQKCETLLKQVSIASEQVNQLQFNLAEKEAEAVRKSRAMSLDRTPTLPSPEDQISSCDLKISQRPSTDQSVKALKAECERLALENSRLKASSQQEYIRNIILRYLQLPDQRKSLLPVIASVFRYTDRELSTIRNK